MERGYGVWLLTGVFETDVLMVWHSFMLNPKCYYDDCFALGVPSMLSIAFPWETIVSRRDPVRPGVVGVCDG